MISYGDAFVSLGSAKVFADAEFTERGSKPMQTCAILHKSNTTKRDVDVAVVGR